MQERGRGSHVERTARGRREEGPAGDCLFLPTGPPLSAALGRVANAAATRTLSYVRRDKRTVLSGLCPPAPRPPDARIDPQAVTPCSRRTFSSSAQFISSVCWRRWAWSWLLTPFSGELLPALILLIAWPAAYLAPYATALALSKGRPAASSSRDT
jgi:hypothetical protein